MSTLYRRSKLGWGDMFGNLVALGSKHAIKLSAAKLAFMVQTSKMKPLSCLRNKSSWLRKYCACAVLGVAACSALYLLNMETIPYSKRTRWLPLSTWIVGDIKKNRKYEYEGKVLAATHPTNVRVSSIAKNVIDALHRDLRGHSNNNVWGWSWRRRNRSRAFEFLDHVNWEVVVVDAPFINNAWTDCAGKIVVYTGLLRDCNSDAEIASTIGHEVAHVVARHKIEKNFKSTWFMLLEILFEDCIDLSTIEQMLYNRVSQKVELEADYIGLLLMASAGYHPHAGLTEMRRRTQHEYDYSYWTRFYYTHPSTKERVQLLAKAQDEAMKYYMNSPIIHIRDETLISNAHVLTEPAIILVCKAFNRRKFGGFHL